MKFPENLKQLREKNNFTQKELAENIQVNIRTLRRYESGEVLPSYEKLLQLAKLFDVTVDYLLGRAVSAESLQRYVSELSKTELQTLQTYISEQLDNKQTK
ncbi:helix-turn-helix domain-containing protein [Enterococcus dispar]